MASIDSKNNKDLPRNPWIEKSIDIANSPGYLDRLHEVYPVIQEGRRTLPPEIKSKLKEIYCSQDDMALVRELLLLRSEYRFPIKDPYVAFLGKAPKFLQFNPRTVTRIAQQIRALGFEGMVASLEEPKEFNRQIGTLFKKWLSKIGYPFLLEENFVKTQEIAFLEGSDGKLKTFANTTLGCRLEKAPDFIAKVQGKYVVGEAKFLTHSGGHQDNQFKDAMRLLAGKKGKAERVAILDGVVWIKSSTKMYKRICELERPSLSALLLKEFLESLKRG